MVVKALFTHMLILLTTVYQDKLKAFNARVKTKPAHRTRRVHARTRVVSDPFRQIRARAFSFGSRGVFSTLK